MRILIVGAGAIGSVLGGFLAQSGHHVTLLGRPTHLQAIQAQGLRISGIWGEHRVQHALDCVTDVHALSPNQAVDWAIITVKAYDTASVMQSIMPYLGPQTWVCAYQNGLGNAEIIAEHVGWARTAVARAIFGAWMPTPGHVEVTVIAQPSALGPWNPTTPVAPIHALVKAMDDAGIPSVYAENMPSVIWSKVAYNCALNPLSALLDHPYGQLPTYPAARSMINAIVTELYAVGHHLGIALNPLTADAYLEQLYNTLIPATAAHYASMRADFMQQRRTEIHALNGAISRLGQQHHIPCPYNTLITRLVQAREAACIPRHGINH